MASIEMKQNALPEKKRNLTFRQKICFHITVAISAISIVLIVFKLTVHSIGTYEYETEIQQRLFFDCNDKTLKFQIMRYGDFWFLKNFVIGEETRQIGCVDAVTYVTQSDDFAMFFQQLPQLIRIWQSHISVSLYANGTELAAIKSSIYYARSCLPESQDISRFVTFHVLLPFGHLPYVAFNKTAGIVFTCETSHLVLSTRELSHDFTYPLNIALNLARSAANTALILHSHQQLLPFGRFNNTLYESIYAKFCQEHINENRHIVCKGSFEALKVAFVLPVYQLMQQLNGVELTTNVVRNANGKNAVKGYSPRYPVLVGHKSMPLFDERAFEQEEIYPFMKNFSMELQNYTYYQLHDTFVVLNQKTVSENSQHISDQQLMMNFSIAETENLRKEYLVLFGNGRSE